MLRWLLLGGMLAAYVLMSSALGLVVPLAISLQSFPPPAFQHPGPVGTFVEVWSANAGADLIFVSGAVVAALVGFTRRSAFVSIALAGGITWATYAIAATVAFAPPHFGDAPAVPPAPENLAYWLPATLFYGSAGLAFAAVAPAMARRRWTLPRPA